MKRSHAIVLMTILLLVAGCAKAQASAAEPVEAYLQAIVDQDVDRLSTLVCADYADAALLELDAFMGVEATLQDVKCSELETVENDATVTCTGAIVATYNNEQQEFSLVGRQYQLVQEGGEWLVCGYQ